VPEGVPEARRFASCLVFVIFMPAACGGVYTAATGEIRSPYFPNPYPGDKECIYIIRQAPGTIITLTFVTFDVEAVVSNSSIFCLYDYVEVLIHVL
jgi:cubilin